MLDSRSTVFFLIAAAVAIPCSGQDPRALVLAAAEIEAEQVEAQRNYTFVERDTFKHYSGGKVKKTESRVWDVTNLYGRPYRRLMEKDGQALPAAEAAKEQAKMDKELARRSQESDSARAKRAAKEAKELDEERKVRREIGDAFELRLLGEETVNGIDSWVIEGWPRKGYRPKSSEAKMFSKLRGKLWIAKQEKRIVRVEAEFTDTASFGLFLFRIAPGTRMTFDTVRLGDVWMPARVWFRGAARAALVKKFDLEAEMVWSDYRRFGAESKVIAAGAPISQ